MIFRGNTVSDLFRQYGLEYTYEEFGKAIFFKGEKMIQRKLYNSNFSINGVKPKYIRYDGREFYFI